MPIDPLVIDSICGAVRDGAPLFPMLARYGITPQQAKDDNELRTKYNAARDARNADVVYRSEVTLNSLANDAGAANANT